MMNTKRAAYAEGMITQLRIKLDTMSTANREAEALRKPIPYSSQHFEDLMVELNEYVRALDDMEAIEFNKDADTAIAGAVEVLACMVAAYNEQLKEHGVGYFVRRRLLCEFQEVTLRQTLEQRIPRPA